MFRIFTGVILLVAACAANAQSKDQLVQRLLELWHVENVGITMLHGPVDKSLRDALAVSQGRVPPERREGVLKDIAADAQKFYDETEPMVKATTKKLAQSTVAPILAAKFTEAELRQIIAILESPVKKKFEDSTPEMQKALGLKVADEMKDTITPKMEALQKKIGERLKAAATVRTD